MKPTMMFLCALLLAAGAFTSASAQSMQKREGPAILPAPQKAPTVKTASADSAAPASGTAEGQGFRIDQPGTITFTVGVTIKGKVEKPQVMIFLPKEKSYYKKIAFAHSFKNDLLEPLPFVPVKE
ncbi:MAG: hypothetical protein PHC61_08700 [Chitinivibrionales bacterium]|nr:hypothetical protein [Chitinivibrionales bacterium]